MTLPQPGTLRHNSPLLAVNVTLTHMRNIYLSAFGINVLTKKHVFAPATLTKLRLDGRSPLSAKAPS